MNKYVTQIKQLPGHELISGSFYIFLGTTISSFLAFILNLYFVRNLSYADYGVFAALISVILLLIIPANSLVAVIVRYATRFFTKGEDDRAGAFYVKLFKYLFIFALFVVITFVVITPLISKFLKIENDSAIFITGLTVAVTYLAYLNTAFLQSKLLFSRVGFLNIIAGILKLTVGVLMVYLGFEVFGALFANLMFPVVGLLGGMFLLRNVIRKRSKNVNIPKKEFLQYALPSAIAIIALSSFISTDVILVKHFFAPDDAGLYGGLSLIGRVIFYFTFPIPIVMFPLVVKRYTKGQKYNSLLYLSLAIVLMAGFVITSFYYLFPGFTINVFLGGRAYLSLTPLVALFGLFLTLYSLNNVMVNFFLSIKKTFVAGIVVAFALIQIVLIFFYHDTFEQIIGVSLLASVLLLASLILYYLKVNGEEKKERINASN